MMRDLPSVLKPFNSCIKILVYWSARNRKRMPAQNRSQMRKTRVVMIVATCVASAAMSGQTLPRLPASAHSSRQPIRYLAPTRENYLKLSAETEAMLDHDVLEVWFPRCVDNQHGGFSSNFRRDW